MKTLIKISFCLLIASIISCSNESDDTTTNNLMTLNKRVIFRTQSLNPSLNMKEIEYYLNNEIVADTIFNYLNEWTHRKIIITNGTTKTYQTLTASGEITEHREETYDNQGRITSRRTYDNNIIAISYIYNSDNTVTANAINTIDLTVNYIGTYYKNSDGLIYKEMRPSVFEPFTVTESTIEFDGLKPISLTNSSTLLNFDYYPNPKPSNTLKSTNELNNRILLSLSLTKLAEDGNFYYKRNNGNANGGIITTYQTNFNSNNYIEYSNSTYVNTSGINNLLTTEIFYYYN